MLRRLDIVMFLAMSLWALPSHSLPEEAPRLVVGALLPLSGNGAGAGESVRNGIIMALNRLPEDRRRLIDLRWEDDQMTPNLAIAAFNKLLRSGKIDIIVNFSAQTANALAPIVEVNKIPMLAMSSDRNTAAARRYTMLFWITPEAVAETALSEAVRRGYRRVARINSLHEGRLALRDELDLRNNSRIEIVLDENYPLEVRDFRPFLTRLKLHPDTDAVAVNLFFGQIGLFARQAREMGVRAPLFSFEPCADMNEQQLADGALKGKWYVAPSATEPSFNADYAKQFPRASSFAAANGYDAVMLVADAASRGISTPEALNRYLHSLREFKGAMGSLSSTADNRFTIAGAVRTVE